MDKTEFTDVWTKVISKKQPILLNEFFLWSLADKDLQSGQISQQLVLLGTMPYAPGFWSQPVYQGLLRQGCHSYSLPSDIAFITLFLEISLLLNVYISFMNKELENCNKKE